MEEAPIGDPMRDVLYGPMLGGRFAERFEGWLDLVQDHHSLHGSTATGRITPDNPREGFVGDAEAARTWMAEPAVALGDRTPLAYARNEAGAQRIEDLLLRIEHGVYG